MVRWLSLAVLSLALPCYVQSLDIHQQFPLQVDITRKESLEFDTLRKDPLHHAHRLLKHNPLVDTHK